MDGAAGWTVQAYQVALDPSPIQQQATRSHAGAKNFAYNTMLAAVTANLAQRDAERTYGIADAQLTPSLGWSMMSPRREWNRRKHQVAVRGDGTPWWAATPTDAAGGSADPKGKAAQCKSKDSRLPTRRQRLHH